MTGPIDVQAIALEHLLGLQSQQPVLNRAGLQALVLSLTHFSQPTSVYWKTDPKPMVSDQDRALIELDLFSMMGDNWDDRRRVYGLPGYPSNAYVTVQLGNRTLKVTMRAETYDAAIEAAELIDQVRMAIYSDAANAQLNAMNLSFSDAEQATRLSYTVDNRIVNCAVADFTFLGVAQFVSAVCVDGSGGDTTWIETVDTNNIVPGTLTQ